MKEPYYDQDGYIIANYSKVTLKAMAAHLGWKWQGVQQRVNRLIKQGRLCLRKLERRGK